MKYVSLGSFGGYVIVGFDHSIPNKGGYDFAIQGNAFLSDQGGSNEPGIVWVMQDVNGNGLPDDEWYELKGSETGNGSTIQDYEVTYRCPHAQMFIGLIIWEILGLLITIHIINRTLIILFG